MFCSNCGQKVDDSAVFCENCGERIVRDQPNEKPPVQQEPVRETPPQAQQTPPPVETAPVYQQGYQQQGYQQPPYQQAQPIIIQQREITQDQLPAKFRPLSAWAYFGYNLLFAIPIVGFIFLIIFSCSSANINRRSFARSYWCALILAAIAAGTVLLILAITGNFYLVRRYL